MREKEREREMKSEGRDIMSESLMQAGQISFDRGGGGVVEGRGAI